MMKSRRNLIAACIFVVTLFLFLFPPGEDFSYRAHPPPPPPQAPQSKTQQQTQSQAQQPKNPADASDNGAISPFGDFSVTDRPMMPAHDPLCAQLPGRTASIVLIVKTGATESFSKIPTQLQTILRCVPDLLLFSDMEQTIAGAHVRDSLDTVLPEVKNHSDFNLYHAQKQCLVSQADCTRHRDKGKEGWNMDKYKNIHIAEKAYNLRPGRDWYVVIDADTYLFWTTLVSFLGRLDPSRKLLLGSIAHYKDFPFAHGGSGYIMSRGAMDAFVGENPGIGNAYDQRVTQECCGDWMFSKAMQETSGIPVTQAFPTINGDKIWSVPFGPTHWCHPLATMHHVDSEEMSLFWEFEVKWYLKHKSSSSTEVKPVLLRDMYLEYFLPKADDQREDWNNISEDFIYLTRAPTDDEKGRMVPDDKQSKFERLAPTSLENCKLACEKKSECFQYAYWGDGKCALSKSFKIGYPTNHEEDPARRQTAGWLIDRIKTWVAKQGGCSNPTWPNTEGGNRKKSFFGGL
ncbi:hypothetical protein jhhlp_000505 [Lomentospora prolificans]|uniref:N-acetylgalactosaminide beta-1,3-galactosyltransferase n=1 Tax=Lomentospora prolificans TaxID=41688 RepID=A0A2N3NLB1_9PEZI|nr:hypothetical protein jhhlp_000505 [Lomentospora prolificans]